MVELFQPLFSLAFGIVFIAGGFAALKRKHLIENIPTSKVRSIAMGLVEIHGTVMAAAKQLLTSPFSHQECVYYEYAIEELKKSDKDNSTWVTIKKGSQGQPFYLKDNTGKVLVDPSKADVDVQLSYETQSRWGQEPQPQVMDFLQSINLRHEGLFGINKTMCYKEYIIHPKQKIYVLGTAMDNPHVEESTAQKNEDDIMIAKGKEIFILSGRHEQDLVKTFKLKVAIGFIGGAIFIVSGLWWLIASLGGF